MDFQSFIEELLHITSPFYLERIEKNESLKEVHIYISIDSSYRPSDWETSRIHSYKKRVWEHLSLFEYRCFLHGNIPVYQSKDSGEFSQLEVNFAHEYSRFTLLYEQKVMELMKIHHCFYRVAKQLGIYPQRVEKIYHHYTADLELPISAICATKIGYDETSTRKGHNYITTFVDMETHEILDIEDGKSGQAVAAFAEKHVDPSTVEEISIDMSAAFISAAETHFPKAHITFDKWHVIKLLYKHLEDNKNQLAQVRDSLVLSMGQVEAFFKQKDAEAGKSQLLFMADWAVEVAGNNPFSRTIYRYYDGIVNYFSSKLTNGVLEGLNSTIQTIKRVARGFRKVENFKKIVRFVLGKNYISQLKS